MFWRGQSEIKLEEHIRSARKPEWETMLSSKHDNCWDIFSKEEIGLKLRKSHTWTRVHKFSQQFIENNIHCTKNSFFDWKMLLFTDLNVFIYRLDLLNEIKFNVEPLMLRRLPLCLFLGFGSGFFFIKNPDLQQVVSWSFIAVFRIRIRLDPFILAVRIRSDLIKKPAKIIRKNSILHKLNYFFT